jgi:2-aminoethylphosphonate-pyruvate transaminase
MMSSSSAKKNGINQISPPKLGEPYLLTPGPLTTAYGVKMAMLRDWGSRDGGFRSMTSKLRTELLDMIEDEANEFDCVPIQGSGTFAVEAMLGSLVARDSKSLVLVNGAYGRRIAEILKYLGRRYVVIDKGDYLPPRGDEVASALAADKNITHVIVVHCETSSGILNPIGEISKAVYSAGCKLLIDSMSAFGAIGLKAGDIRYDAFVSSANKCIEGVPGFGFVIARKSELEAAKGNSHSLSLDVYAQWTNMNNTQQWRFTPPTHVIAAFNEALRLHRAEGGVEARGRRYTRNRDVIVTGMRKLGFQTLLDSDWLSPIIVTFFSPADPAFEFEKFYQLLKQKGFVIYPGKLTIADSFRIGCIGQLDEHVMHQVVEAADHALKEMGVKSARPPQSALEERAKLAS